MVEERTRKMEGIQLEERKERRSKEGRINKDTSQLISILIVGENVYSDSLGNFLFPPDEFFLEVVRAL